MSDDEKRVKIATVMKWTMHLGNAYCAVLNAHGTRWQGLLFDPFIDLNACAEMEKVLTAEQCQCFNDLLCGNEPEEHSCEADGWWFHATAAQRCEAFGRVLNLWP